MSLSYHTSLEVILMLHLLAGQYDIVPCFIFHFLHQIASWCPESPICALPCLSAVCPMLPSKQYQYWSGWMPVVLAFRGWNIGHFFFLLLFPSSNHFCGDMVCPCLENILHHYSTSVLPNCRSVVISAVLASRSACSFPLTLAWPGQLIHCSFCSHGSWLHQPTSYSDITLVRKSWWYYTSLQTTVVWHKLTSNWNITPVYGSI